MAVHLPAGAGNYLQRTTALLPTSGDRTWAAWVRQPALPAGIQYNTAFASLDNTPATYTHWGGIFLNASGTGDDLSLTVPAGSHSASTAVAAAGQWRYLAWRSTGGTAQVFYVFAGSVGVFTLNLAGMTSVTDVLGGDSFGIGNIDVAYCRQWTAALTGDELLVEMQSTIAVRTANLYMDCPLTADLLDKSGNGHNWTQVGSGSFIAGPSFVSNSSAATAMPFSTLPQTITQAYGDSLYGWYSYLAPASQVVAGFFGYASFGVDSATVTAWIGPTSAPTQWLAANQVQGVNRAIQVPVASGTNYYFRLLFTNTPTTDVTVSGLNGPTGSIPAGAICINDDTAGFPLAVLSPSSGLPLQFQVFPASERGDPATNSTILPSGILLTDDIDQNLFHLYSSTLSQITTIAYPFSGTPEAVNSDQNATFYVSGWPTAGNSRVATISDAGVVGGTTWTLSGHAFTLCPTLDNTKLYYAAATAGAAIKTWVLGTNMAGADFVAGVAGYVIHDILNLADGTFAVGYQKTSDSFVRHYDAAGTTLATYASFGGATRVNHLCHALDDPASIWVWLFEVSGTTITAFSRFVNLKISDGSFLTDIPGVPQYTIGSYGPTPIASPIRFGHSNSCPFWIMRNSVAPSRAGDPTTIRRERIFRHLSDEQQWIFYQWLQVDAEAGVGLSSGQGSDPAIMVQWSNDGGHTWSNERFLKIGKQGEYSKRAMLRQLGRSRDRVWKVAYSDPTKFALLNAYFEAQKGTS